MKLRPTYVFDMMDVVTACPGWARQGDGVRHMRLSDHRWPAGRCRLGDPKWLKGSWYPDGIKYFLSKDKVYFTTMQYTSDEAYARLISHHMTVPQRIKATGDVVDEEHGPNGLVTGWDYSNEKFDMKVPERILVVGQDQHVGTKAPPREIQLDNAVLPTDPGMIRVSTPPRVITLDQHYFPSADDFPQRVQNHSPPKNARAFRSQGDGARSTTPRPDNFNEATMTESRLVLRDSTPPMGSGEGLSSAEELVHLRRQIVKLNRRVMSIEAEQLQRQQKEKIAYAIGIAYLLIKVISWLNRS